MSRPVKLIEACYRLLFEGERYFVSFDRSTGEFAITHLTDSAVPRRTAVSDIKALSQAGLPRLDFNLACKAMRFYLKTQKVLSNAKPA